CAYVIPKGTADEVKHAGLVTFRNSVGDISSLLRDRLLEIDNWDKVKLLTVEVDRLRRWYRTGLICIGDAAHAMSPIGGVGINLAVQDAVAAANILAQPLRRGTVTVDTLKSVQQRREFPTRVPQRLQIIMQNNLIGPALANKDKRPRAPWFMKLMQWPLLQRIPGRLLAFGVRPESRRQRNLRCWRALRTLRPSLPDRAEGGQARLHIDPKRQQDYESDDCPDYPYPRQNPSQQAP